jgi:preprotein translocase subunit SecA
MPYKNTITKIKRLHQRLNGNTIQYDMDKYLSIINDINKLSYTMQNKGDNQLKEVSNQLKQRACQNENLDILLVEAFALVKETAQRVLKITPFDVQLIGAIVLHQGKIAEMQTGEGKTLAAVFPAYLNALSGKGVHVLTFNDYLAKRDAQWMGPVYEFLGLTVGYVQEGMDPKNRQKSYNADITYLTARESGFDFLRDSVCFEKESMVHRAFNYAIIDEADSILIDEARIPLVLAGNAKIAGTDIPLRSDGELTMAKLSRELKEKTDFDFDEYRRNIHLTDSGLERVENSLGCGNIFEPRNIELLAHLNYALHAQHLLHLDKNYIVSNGRVELVDEFTGRVADKRRWPEGLQAAVEAKENLPVRSNGGILNSIALQYFLRLYPKLCGMTATAQRAHEEFREFYGLHIAVIPSNKTCIRKDLGCAVYATKKDKISAIINEIIESHKEKRPVLVGTESVKDSEEMADILISKGISCEVLNAKNDEHEAKIIAQAGKLGAITISTNMAGRGTDIRLGGDDELEKKQVAQLGGLYVIGAAKYESRRIDDQLRGRAGRQGDPGACRFFISLDDDLFIKYRLRDLLPVRHLSADAAEHPANIGKAGLQASHFLRPGEIKNPFVNKEIDRVQRIIEGQNFEIKKTLWNYTYLIEQQRQILFEKRNGFIQGSHAVDFFKTNAQDDFVVLEKKLVAEELVALCKRISLWCLDCRWSEYLAEVTDIREGIHLRRIGGQNPLFEFHKIVIDLFDTLHNNIEKSMLRMIHNAAMSPDKAGISGADGPAKLPSSTWTYMINDNPFDPMLEVQLGGSVGVSAWAAMLWPLMAIYFIVKKIKRGKS